MSVSYGVGAALTLDEFSLWLNLDPNDYWSREGRISIDAVILFGGILAVGAWGAPFFRGLQMMWSKRERASAKRSGGWNPLFGACGCFVRVKCVDHRRILCRNDAAFELHGRGQFAGILRPLVGNEAKALDGFEVGQAGVGFAHDFAIEGNHAAVGHQGLRGPALRGLRAWPMLPAQQSWARSAPR